MKQLYLILSVFFFIIAAAQKNNVAVGFIENRGQIVDQKGKSNTTVKYLLNTPGLNVQLRNDGFSYDVYETTTQTTKKEETRKYAYHRIDIDFVGIDKNAILVGEGRSYDYSNYYNVAEKREGVTQVHSFQTIVYKNLYHNIDVVFSIPDDKSKPVEYNFIVRPGGRIEDIRLQFRGADTRLQENKIVISTQFGKMQEILPASWIERGDTPELIDISYVKIRKNTYGFSTKKQFSDGTIVIDPAPVRLWGTYFGSFTGYNSLDDIETDTDGNLYLCGDTSDNVNIATFGSFKSVMTGFSDGYLVKFDPDGNRLWGTYCGGEEKDGLNALEIYNNELIAGGTTKSIINIATPGAFKTSLSSLDTDGFIVKFNTDGERIWGTYFGGEGNDTLTNLTIDASGNFIIIGQSYSITGISTPGSFKPQRIQPVIQEVAGEGYIAKFDNDGFQMWGTYYNLCKIWGLDTDSNLNIYFSGDVEWSVTLANFTTAGTHQPNFEYNQQTGIGSTETFVIKFNPDGGRIWGTLYGDSGEQNGGLKVDHDGYVYITGSTKSEEMIATPGAHQITIANDFYGASDSYLAKFNPYGTLLWGTYYGGLGYEGNFRCTIDIDESNNIFLFGSTNSSDGISTTNTYNNGSSDFECFIAKFDSQGIRLWGSYFGGNNRDFSTNIKYDKLGIFYVIGNTRSPNNIATPGAIFPILTASNCTFIEKFKDCMSGVFASSNSPVCIGSAINLTATGGNSYNWTGPNGFTSNEQSPIIPNASSAEAGIYTCIITGGDCDNTSATNVLIGDSKPPVPDVALLPYITGNCNIHLIVIPTATDDCAGIITATTTDSLNYNTPGNYTVTWHYDDGHGNSITQNQNVTMNPNSNTVNPQVSYSQCDDDDDGRLLFDLTNIASLVAPLSMHTFSFYNSANEAATQTNPITDPAHFENGTNPQTVYVHAKNTFSSCESTSQIELHVVAIPKVFPATLYGCDPDGDGFALFDISTANNGIIANDLSQATFFTYHLSLADVAIDNRIGNFTTFENTSNPQVVYIKATNVNTNCYNIAAVTLIPINIPPPPIAVDQIFCEGQNATLHNISIIGTGIKWYASPFSPPSLNINTVLQNNTTYYASQTLNGSCESNRIPINITLLPTPPAPSFTQSQRFCEDVHATIEDVYGIIGENIRFYDYDGNLLPLTTPLINDGNYRYTQTVNGCESIQGDSFHVAIVPLSPAPAAQPNQSFCITLNPTLSNIAVNGVGIRFYDSAIGGNLLPETQSLIDGQTYYLSQTIECESHDRAAVAITLINDFTVNNLSQSICDEFNDDEEIIDLSVYQPTMVNTASAYTFDYYTSFTAAENESVSNKIDDPIHYPISDNTTLFVRISFAGCYGIAQLHFTLLQPPVIPLQDTIPICNNQNITLDAGPGFSSYNWSSGEHIRYVTFSQPGSYSVTVTKNYGAVACSATKDITVVASDIASITHIGTTDWTQNQNTITIDATGPGDYDYSVDSINFQDTNNFTGLQSGLYTVYVRDKNGCGTITDEVYLLMYPNFFTPNGDGQNDTWNIKFSALEPGMEIKIFDRYGKFLKQILRNGTGWDGTYNGYELPSTDYWFVVTRGNGKEYRGHFSLKR